MDILIQLMNGPETESLEFFNEVVYFALHERFKESAMSPSIVLASSSVWRKSLLEDAGIMVVTEKPAFDESTIRCDNPRQLAAQRCLGKLRSVLDTVSEDVVVIGADQVLSYQGKTFDKAQSIEEARQRLEELQGGEHFLHSAYAIGTQGKVVTERIVDVRMVMRNLSSAEMDAYLATGEWQGSVGCYKIEGKGQLLFKEIEGSQSAIIGLPIFELNADLISLGINCLVSSLRVDNAPE